MKSRQKDKEGDKDAEYSETEKKVPQIKKENKREKGHTKGNLDKYGQREPGPATQKDN